MRTRILAAVLGLAGMAAPAAAGTLATPVLSAKAGEFPSCHVANVGTKPVRAVTAELILYDFGPGTIHASNGPADLAPLTTLVASDAAISGVRSYQCRFTFKGSAKLLRANAMLIDGSFDVLDTQPAY